MTTYDPRNMTWDQWSSLMIELFAVQDLGTIPEDRWNDWADAISGFGSFQSSGVGDSVEVAYQIIGTSSLGDTTTTWNIMDSTLDDIGNRNQTAFDISDEPGNAIVFRIRNIGPSAVCIAKKIAVVMAQWIDVFSGMRGR
jgi:hypothetical protein